MINYASAFSQSELGKYFYWWLQLIIRMLELAFKRNKNPVSIFIQSREEISSNGEIAV